MILGELMDMLRGVEDGNLEMNAVVAGEVAGAIEILQTKLNYYETMKREGRLLVLPCKVDATVYDIRRFYKRSKIIRQEIVTGQIDHFTIGEAQKPIAAVCLQGNEWADYEPGELILTREEAEAALANATDTNVGNQGGGADG